MPTAITSLTHRTGELTYQLSFSMNPETGRGKERLLALSHLCLCISYFFCFVLYPNTLRHKENPRARCCLAVVLQEKETNTVRHVRYASSWIWAYIFAFHINANTTWVRQSVSKNVFPANSVSICTRSSPMQAYQIIPRSSLHAFN